MDEIDILSNFYESDLKKQNFDKELIFIVENKDPNRGDNLGFYYNLNISTSALKNGEALEKLNPQQIEARERKKAKLTPEYFEKIEFLRILKKILDLKNPVKPDENNPYNLTPLVEILDQDEYILTVDNFRKMILILYRIIANIPVILMGETGCGKTA